MTMAWKYLLFTILLSVLVHSSNGHPVSSNGQPDQIKRFETHELAQVYANTEGHKGEKIDINGEIFTIGEDNEETNQDPNSGAQRVPLSEAYKKGFIKMHQAVNNIAAAQNIWNIEQYENVRQQIAAAGNNLVQKSKELPVIGTIVNAAAKWIVDPLAQFNDNMWYGAKNRIDATIQHSTNTLKQAKSLTKPSDSWSFW